MTDNSDATGAPSALSRARQVLAAGIRATTAAAKAHEAILQPARRFSDLIRAAEEAEAALVALRAADDAALADWLARGDDSPRPEPSPALMAAETRAAALARDARAARSAMGRQQAEAEAAARVARSAMVDRDLAMFATVAEEAERIGRELRRRLSEALAVDGMLDGLYTALVEMAHAANADPATTSAAMGAAGRIGEIRSAAKLTAAAPSRPAEARAFVNKLRSDPTAQLTV